MTNKLVSALHTQIKLIKLQINLDKLYKTYIGSDAVLQTLLLSVLVRRNLPLNQHPQLF